MIAACLFVILIYLGLYALFWLVVHQIGIIAGGDYFVSDVAYDIGGEWLKWVMRITIAISSATECFGDDRHRPASLFADGGR
jgi:hypothetical protein